MWHDKSMVRSRLRAAPPRSGRLYARSGLPDVYFVHIPKLIHTLYGSMERAPKDNLRKPKGEGERGDKSIAWLPLVSV